jgi:hypothetical protein
MSSDSAENDNEPQALPHGRVARVKGVPTKTTTDDVVKFFTGFAVAEVHLRFKERRTTGEVQSCLIGL